MSLGLVQDLKAKMQKINLNLIKLKGDYEKKESVLLKETQIKEKAEAEVAALLKRIRQLEDELESTETRLTEATGKLEEASKAADESDRCRRTLETWRTFEGSRIDRLTESVKTTTNAINESNQKYEEASRKLTLTEVELERAESRLEAAESRSKELQEILHEATCQLRSLEHHESQTVKQCAKYEEQIKLLTKQLAETEKRALQSRELEVSLQNELSQLDETLETDQAAHENLRKEMDSMMNEINNI